MKARASAPNRNMPCSSRAQPPVLLMENSWPMWASRMATTMLSTTSRAPRRQ
ncbi:Uncharacterised protein [Bordetella pertussis]|nr:Uncharacterised protein [Bordetella pertussis]